MPKPAPTATEWAAARASKPHHIPPTAEYRNGWMITGPRGNQLFYDTEEEAALTAETGVY